MTLHGSTPLTMTGIFTALRASKLLKQLLTPQFISSTIGNKVRPPHSPRLRGEEKGSVFPINI